MVFLGNLPNLPKIPRFHHPIFKNFRSLFKIINVLIRFTDVSRSSTTIQDLLSFHHHIFPLSFKTIEVEDCFGPTKNIFRNWAIRDFPNPSWVCGNTISGLHKARISGLPRPNLRSCSGIESLINAID